MPIIMRLANDHFIALQIANGMEEAGANVFNVTSNGQATYDGALAPHTRYVVWAKVKNDKMADLVDEAIDKALDT